MTVDEFWKIIGNSISETPEEQIAKLKTLLEAKDPDDVLAFQTAYFAQLDRAYRWDLWGAAFVINGGCSDDGFDYFCDWLISKGQGVFDAAIANPESLASVDLSGDTAFEEFRYVADEVYLAQTGKDMVLDLPSRGEPVGQPFDEETIEDRFPRLADAAHEAEMHARANDPEVKALQAVSGPVFTEENERIFDERLRSFIGKPFPFSGAIHNHVTLQHQPQKDGIEARCWSIELADGRVMHAAKYVIDFGDALEGIPADVLAYVQANPRFHEPPQTHEEQIKDLMQGIRPKPSMDEEVGQATDQALKSGDGAPILASAERVGAASVRLTFDNMPECRAITLHGCDKNGSGDVHGVWLMAEKQTLCLSRFGVERQVPNKLWGW